MTMNEFKKLTWLAKVVRYAMVVVVLAMASGVFAQEAPAEGATAAVEIAKPMVEPDAQAPLFYSIAGIMAVACMSAAFAVGKIGAAVMGAAAEKPEVLGKAIAFVGLGEGIALFGFLVSLFMVLKIG